jgi:hypothetical protein
MRPETSFDLPNDPANGLPVVQPPSGGFIAKLFLVPFLIVSIIVGFVLLFDWLVTSTRKPGDFLKRLDDPNPDIRWRGAEDLAQILLRDDRLASDPSFALDIAERLEQAFEADVGRDTAVAETPRQPSKGPEVGDITALDPRLKDVLYLSSCPGNFMIPVGAPVLSAIAVSERGSNTLAVARRRYRAVFWGLGNLGKNVQRFNGLSSDQQEQVLAALGQEANADSRRGQWAATALDYLRGSRQKSLEALGVVPALLKCAESPDPFLRKVTAVALSYWEGTPAENARMEEALAKLERDDGHGEEFLAQMRTEDKAENEAVPGRIGLEIRYEATLALARRGSNKLRLDVLTEMLDPALQEAKFRIQRKNGQDSPDEEAVYGIIDGALKAIAALHHRQPDRDLSQLRPAVDQLAQNAGNLALRGEAIRVRGELTPK